MQTFGQQMFAETIELIDVITSDVFVPTEQNHTVCMRKENIDS